MNILKSILIITILTFITVSCSDNNDTLPEESISKRIDNLHAKQTTDYSVNPPKASGEFIKFSFKKGVIVTDDNWDIAFRATTIIVNGGESTGIKEEPNKTGNASLLLVDGTFSSVKTISDNAIFKQDEKDGVLALPKSTWYSYFQPAHRIDPVAGKIIVIKTIDGNYAKMEILSYYKDMDSSNSADPQNSGGQYYTFNYVYNPNIGDKNLQ
ncbi:HmuY family protein [Tenacibaculum salmonis]|uniref:HmuY family protein n=1 Tax=Tenacibaculum sp. P3-BQ1 TaxID=3232310 RepID=UPI0034DEA19F